MPKKPRQNATNKIMLEQNDNQASQKEIQTKSEEDVRNEIVNETELDEEIDKDRIEKLVKREMALREDSKSAVGQKIKARDRLHRRNKTLQKAGLDKTGKPLKKGDDNKDKGKGGKKETPAEMEARIEANILGKMELSKLELSDDLMQEVKDYAAFKKISIGEALEKQFIKNLIKDAKDDEEEINSSASSKERGGVKGMKDGDTVNFEKIKVKDAVKLPTKTYEKYRKWVGNKNSMNPIQKIEE